MTALDHVVVNTLHGMAAAASTFAALGFNLTPLGRHSLGSINHLMMTRGAYLELVGVPEVGLQRQDVLDSPYGLNGLVLTTADPDAEFARLSATDLGALPPMAFSRPVEIAGVVQEARFRTMRVPAATFPAGRVYFCQHLTPEFVWRDEWLDHENGFQAIDGMVVESPSPADEAQRYAIAFGVEGHASGSGWAVALPAFHLDIVEGPTARFASLRLRFTTLDVLERRALSTSGVVWTRRAAAADLIVGELGLHLECRSAA